MNHAYRLGSSPILWYFPNGPLAFKCWSSVTKTLITERRTTRYFIYPETMKNVLIFNTLSVFSIGEQTDIISDVRLLKNIRN